MSLFRELKRRNVFRVAAAYAVTAWLVIQVVETILPAFGFGDAALRNVTIAFAVGLVPVLVLAWVFEWTPEGLKRDSDLDRGRPVSLQAVKRLDRIILVVLALALGYFGFDKFVLEQQREVARQRAQAEQLASATAQAREEGRGEAIVESYGDQSIAVLPFVNMSSDPEQEFFSDGIAEEILNKLAQVTGLRVLSRSSSFAYKGQALEAPEIARRLNVTHVLEGSVRRAGNTVRITAQLIQARSDTHLWSQTWDRELEDVFAVQDEVASHIASQLRLNLVGEPSAGSQVNPRAYETVLRGRYLLHQLDQESGARAIPIFKQAIEIQPDYAAAHAGLAEAMRQAGWPENETRDAWRSEISLIVDRALTLDPRESQALAIKGYLHYWATDHPDEAMAQELWRQAIKANPSNGDALRWLAGSYQDKDSLKFLETQRQAYRVDPTRWVTNYVLVHTLNDFGHYDESIEVARKFNAMDPDSIDPFLWYGDIHFVRGDIEEALKAFYFVYRAEPRDHWKWSATAWALGDLEEWKLMEAWARKLLLRMPGDALAAVPLAVALTRQGKPDEALSVLEPIEGAPPDSDKSIASGIIRMSAYQDYTRALREIDAGLTRPGSSRPEINPMGNMNWFYWMNYTAALKLAGHETRAEALVTEMLKMLHGLNEAGVIAREGWSIGSLLAALYAQIGDMDSAIHWLQVANNQPVRACAYCFRMLTMFDSLRHDPRFEAMVNQANARNQAHRQRLDEAGLLLTPDELSALEQFEFDPFGDG